MTSEIKEGQIGPGGCRFWTDKKKRFCKMVAKEGAEFCGQHMQDDLRRKCVYCKSMIEDSRMAKHMKKCNIYTQSLIKPKYYNEKVNLDKTALTEEDLKSGSMKLSDFSLDEVKSIVNLLKNGKIKNTSRKENFEPSFYQNLEKEIESNKENKKVLKHLIQQSSLLEIMNKEGLLANGNCFLELGAGTGGLSEKVAEVLDISSFIIVDRGSFRKKKENALKNEGRDAFERVKGDIADFDPKLLSESNEKKICIAKHLCGSATDLAIQCATRIVNFGGILVASCCHHKCTWQSFSSREVLSEDFKSAKRFRLLTLLSSWFTCGFKKSEGDETDKFGLKVAEKIEIGALAKTVIDNARRDYLLKTFPELTAKTLQYCTLETSLESSAIILSYSFADSVFFR